MQELSTPVPSAAVPEPIRQFTAPLIAFTGKTWDGIGAELIKRRLSGTEEFNWLHPQHMLMAKLAGPSGKYQTKIGDERCNRGRWQGRFLSLFPADQLVQAQYNGSGESDCTAILVSPQTVVAVAAEMSSSIDLIPQDHFDDPHIWSAVLALRDECLNGGLFGSLYVETISTFLILHLLRQYSTLTLPSVPAKGGLSSGKLNCVLDYIYSSLADEITLDELAAIAGLSSFHFLRAFKQSTGLSPHKYLISKRIEWAKVLLSSSQQTVTEIAMECGFANPSHFTVIFRRNVGMTPRDFRKSL